MRHVYEPLQPLPEVEFAPDGEVSLRTPESSITTRAEMYGLYCVFLLNEVFSPTMTGEEEYTVAHVETGIVFLTFSDLRVARNFAGELNDCLDFNQILDHRNDSEAAERFRTQIRNRGKHTTLLDYNQPNAIF